MGGGSSSDNDGDGNYQNHGRNVNKVASDNREIEDGIVEPAHSIEGALAWLVLQGLVYTGSLSSPTRTRSMCSWLLIKGRR